MSSDWPVYTVQQLVDDKILAKPKDGNHGSIHPKSSDYVETGVPFVMATDMIENGVDFKNCKFITKEMAASLRKGFAEPGDVLLSHKATIGRTCILQDHPFSTVVLTPQVTYYRVLNRDILNNQYLHYYFKSEGFQGLFNSWAGGGSTRAYLGITDQRKLPITLPPIATQRDIARILGDIDQIIHINQQTNETLEAMAQAIFKSWFVDFDSVRAKIEAKSAGRDPNRAAMAAISGISFEMDLDDIEATLDQKLSNMTEEQRQLLTRTAQLFPDELVESEIGEVPKGWGVKPFYDTIEIIGGGTPKTKIDEYWDGDILWYSVVDAPNESDIFVIDTEKKITETGLENSSAKLVDAGTTIISARGTVGKLALTPKPMTYNQSCYGLRSKNDCSYFNFYKTKQLVENLKRGSHGSVFDTITQKTFKTIDIAQPSENLENKFDEVVESIMSKIQKNSEENITLSQIRDTLLPKLISGEIKMN